MPKTINVAAIQMDVTPAAREKRLARAETLIAQAAQAGAQLAALPELFNTGYQYATANFMHAEGLDGPTVDWMRRTAARWSIHLAGSMLLWDGQHIFNSLLLYAPDGRLWRYDKNYPWAWERNYFRAGRRIRVANTDLGRIGLLVCWDSAHPKLWRSYAGLVDLMVVSSCPPDLAKAALRLPDGGEIGPEAWGAFGEMAGETVYSVFDRMLAEQSAWLGVPTVSAAAGGVTRTALPQAQLSLLALAPFAPTALARLAGALPQARQVQVVCPLADVTRIIGPDGVTLARVEAGAGETFIMHAVSIPGAAQPKPPKSSQPPAPVPGWVYLLSDWLLPFLGLGNYRLGRLRRARSEEVLRLPGERRPIWAAVFVGILALAAALGWFWRRKRRQPGAKR